jgi:hypothetical protein
MNIKSQVHLGNTLQVFTQDVVKKEPMLFSVDWEFAYKNGGPLTRNFLDNLNVPDKKSVVIDSRVHMLMKDCWPCIPGFHHDDVPRDREDGQPEYDTPSYRSQHAMALYNGDICPTEFAIGEADFTDPKSLKTIYKEWHKEVSEKIETGALSLYLAPSNQIIYFDDRTWHQGTQAKGNGWRFFIRASWNTKRHILNEMRTQVQVYLSSPFEGW